ncbi:hypothetical protein MRX96_047672 [Rhipicephalus microplus]
MQGCAETTNAYMYSSTPMHKEPNASGCGKRRIDASSSSSERSCVVPNNEFSAFRASGPVYNVTIPLACFDVASFSNCALQHAPNSCLKTSNIQVFAINKFMHEHCIGLGDPSRVWIGYAHAAGCGRV